MAKPKGEVQWKQKGGDFVTFDEPNDSIEGILTKTEEVAFPNGTVGRYTFSTEEGPKICLGSVGLDSLMSDVDLGERVRIVFIGEGRTKSNNPFKQFDVFVAE